jgi:predicted cation transporter
VKHVEEELEAFLLLMGAAAVTLSHQWSLELLRAALTEPIALTGAVLGAGALFHALRPRMRRWVQRAQRAWGGPALASLLVLSLGLASAFITAIIAALVLAEAVSALRLPRKAELRLVVFACAAIGLGSGLTPLGGPLAAITVGRLRGDPYNASFWFLSQSLGPQLLGLIVLLAALAFFLTGHRETAEPALVEDQVETWSSLGWRGFKAYLFVAGLVLLGQGFAPLAEQWLLGLPAWALYWANMSSAVLDNATLAAAEVGPKVPPEKLRALLYGLMLSGCMLIPGNVPNIICASKLRLRSRDWAREGVPLGLGLMLLMGLALFAF